MSLLIKQTLFCIFILMTLGLFLTCDDPTLNPFTNNQGEKVVVEPPTIFDISPVSGSYLNGVVTFTATAKAYIRVERVEVYVYEDEDNGQREVKWTDSGIQLSGSVRLKQMSYEFDTKEHNNWDFKKKEKTTPRDGMIRMKFRVFDSAGIDRNGKPIPEKAIESIELIYIIKNNPSVITMAYPNETDIAKASEPAKVSWNGEIRGQVIDRRGLRPGYPQIKLWPEGMDEPDDNHPEWGYASLFLTGYDNIEKEGADETIAPAGPGFYADRSKMRVVNAASFSLHLAKYTIETDPVNPDLRHVKYVVENNKHVPFEANGVYKFKIRTRDVSPDPLNGSIPIVDPDPIDPNKLPWIEGFFPPREFGTPLADSFYMRGTYDDGKGNVAGDEEPVLITIFSSDSKLTVELNNDDIGEEDSPQLKNKPNIYIQKTEKTSYKIEQSGFRLRLLVFFDGKDGGELAKAELEWQHKNGDNIDIGSLLWDDQTAGQDYKGEPNTYGDGKGWVFTYTYTPHSTPPIFTHSTVRYVLVFKVWIKGQGLEEKDAQKYYYYVYIDGKGPTVSIRSVQGAADVKAPSGANAVAYTVNGNIQAVVDSKDENSIMAYSKGTDMGESPPVSESEFDNYPMVKWIVDRATVAEDKPSGAVQTMLDKYRTEPTWDNLREFKAITDSLASSLTSLPSGWVRRPLATGSDLDKNNHFKLNTSTLTDGDYYWLYVIGMDQVQNLGYTAKKIYVDQSTDRPQKDIKPLSKDNTQITGKDELDVSVEVNLGTGVATKSGNWSSADGRSNVLDRDDNIILNFTDDDGISLEKGGVSIILRDLNTPSAPNNPVTYNADTLAKRDELQKLLTGGERDWSGTLSQKIMADAFYGEPNDGKLKDGKYSLEIAIKDDIDRKVAIGDYDRKLSPPQTVPGDIPTTATTDPTPIVYYFAVSTNEPEIIIEKPENGTKASAVPIDVYGTVKSRFTMQSMWITFNPNVAAYPPNTNPNPGSLYIRLDMTPASPAQDADGYYVYNWKRENVVFNPSDPSFKPPDMSRRFTVVAYDQLGNTNSEECVLKVDDDPPSINLIEFNYKRPADSDGKAYVYGKVPFTVSASDTGGLLDEKVDGFLMSGVKWWVFEASDPVPAWDTPPRVYTKTNPLFTLTPNTWTGGGYFRDNQKRSGGQYTGVIDTRYLVDKTTEYKLYLMAMDIAGNVATESVIIKAGGIDKFTIDQSRDNPVIYENNLNPKPGNVVILTNLTISGRVGDADLFDPAATGNSLSHTYVEIRFPSAVDSVTGAPTAWPPDRPATAANTGWIPIDIPATYGVAGIDPGNAIVYRFRLDDYSSRYPLAYNYLKDDGPKYYQIRVTDEPDAGPAGKNYGKNPDEFMRTAKDETGVPSPATDPNYNPNYGNLLYPGYNTGVYQRHDKISKIFPDNDSNGYKFFVDISKPEIFFNLADPTSGHENYSADRLTFSQWEQLKRALNNQNYLTGAPDIHGKGNYVKEYKLRNLSFSWSAGSDTTPLIKVILNNPEDPAVAGEYPWSLKDFTADDDTNLETIFNKVSQGLQIIVFEATDMVDQTGRVSWVFAKDTQGPAINFNNITRAIKRVTIPTPASDYPDWPPNSTKTWKSSTPGSWNSVTWINILRDWPSEYAFKAAAEVISALTTENNNYASLSTVNGDEYSLPVIKGNFEDENSSVRITIPAGVNTFFYYRFKDKKGNVQPIPSENKLGTQPINDGPWNNGTWIEKKIEEPVGNQNPKSANWEIILNKDNGFGGTDGENWVDIRVADTAGNISEIFNVAFLVDRAPPLLGGYDVVLPAAPPAPKEIIPGEFRVSKIGATVQTHPALRLPEDQRVFSAAGTGNTDTNKLFQISGRVNDYNLNYLKITLGQDGFTSYTVTSEAFIDPSALTVTSYKDSDGYTDSGHTRLTLAGPYLTGTSKLYDKDNDTGVPEWEWTLDILGKDAYGLRNAAKIGSDDEFSTRRYIRVTASDKSGKSAPPVEWPFYLDTKKPIIEYTNLDKGREGSSFESDVKLSGLVSDDTKIKNLYFIIGRWNYTTKVWNWYDSSSAAADKWVLLSPPAAPTAPPADLTKWTDYFTNDTSPARQTSMEFVIDNEKLNATGKYPTDLLKTEGQYRIDLYVTDWSYGSGNPHNTKDGDNSEAPSTSGFKDTGYDPKNNAGSASARVFYIDKDDPILRWASTIEDKTYFRNESVAPNVGQVIFGFIAGDGNTLQSWKAEVRENGTIISISDGTTWQNGTTAPAKTAIPEPLTVTIPATPAPPAGIPPTTGGHKISDTSIDEQYFEIKPFMTVTGTSAGNALDVGKEILPTYSITITVTDGAKRTSSITKQFTLDNTPPKFVVEKYNPQSFKRGEDPNGDTNPASPEVITTGPPQVERFYSYDAVTGKLSIRGNTTDNSNQIKSISYYVVNSAQSSSFTAYPKPADIEAAGNWRSSAAKNTEIQTSSGTTLIELDEGTLFAWSILAPQTSLFLGTDSVAQTLVKKTTTNGKTIKDEDPATVGRYRDVDPTNNWTTNAEKDVPKLRFPDLNNPYADDPKVIYGGEDVGLLTIYIRAEDAAGNVAYDAIKYWIWPEGDRPIITAINTPDSSKPIIERMLNGTIRLSGMAKDNERVKYVWFRVWPADANGKPTGTPYTNLKIPKWQDTDKTTGNPIGGNWDEAGTGNQDPPADGLTIGATKSGDAITAPTGGWYMANGGHARDVSWWAYINTNGELDPTGTAEYKDFYVEVRAQDVTFDEKNNRWMPYENGYMGMASATTEVSSTTGRVVANAPVFDTQRIAPKPSDVAEAAETPATNPVKYWDTLDNISIRNRSSYKVTVSIKPTMGLSSIRWSPTQWYKDKNVSADIGAFRVNPNIDSFNLLSLAANEYVYLNSNGTYGRGDKTTAFAALTAGTASMAMTVNVKTMNGVYPTECVVFVDMRADKLLQEMLDNDPAYGDGSAARAGQTKNSVRYPLYMSASDISKPNPLTSRGDALLPIDNKEPYGMYTLNRKPAGTAVTIGGEAGDDGPVKGVARVVMWFQEKDSAVGVSWHKVAKGTGDGQSPDAPYANAGVFTAYTANSGPAWWDDIGIAGGGVIPATGVTKPAIPAIDAAGAATGSGASAIVIDTNSPSVGKEKWGHKLPMGFADGGIGKLWYVEINSYGLPSGPIDLHYVVIDKAGNATHYKTRLVIMNDVAVIDRIKLATDIRHNSSFPATNSGQLAGAKIVDKDSPPLVPAQWPILNTIRDRVPLGGSATDINDDIKKGISDWVSASALGADKVIDFNVRNNLFALRVETTKGAKSARTFRIDYVSNATLMSDNGPANQKLTDIKEGDILIINDRGNARWGTFGAEGDDWKRGYAFIATVGGSDLDQLAKDNIGTGSAWRLTTPTAQRISTSSTDAAAATAESAEFQYGTGSFGAGGIVDCNGPNDIAFPPTGAWGTWTNNNWSLFVLRVFDGPEANYFGDFAILRVRVNNDDKTPPFAQLYDLNPKTEGQDRSNIAGDSQTVDKRRSVSPMSIGGNRTKGGLWNDSPTLGSVEKPGHIEPRRMNGNGYGSWYATQQHSLSSAQMGGAETAGEASITKPFANPAGFFNVDTVSGKVVLRGYAEDDQRIQQVALRIGNETDIVILNYYDNRAENTSPTAYGRGTAGDSATYTSPKTGLLSVPTAQAANVYFTDSIDLNRHRVEWAYIWDTETTNAGNVAGNGISVRVVSYPRNGAAGTTPKTSLISERFDAPGTAHVSTPDSSKPFEATRPNTSPYNRDFPVGLNKYNRITVNLRPYIAGFLRNTSAFSHNTRSRQGRYMFYQGEIAVLKGFNLGAGTISINGTALPATVAVPAGDLGSYGITTANDNQYRRFTVGTGTVTGNGLVTYANTQDAVNTGGERSRATTPATPVRPAYIQPWNVEYSPGIDGSTLWDDFTQVHIWRSNDSTSGTDRGQFPKDNNMEIFDPAMSIDPENGDLWESHNEGGGNGGNSGSTKVSNNNGAGSFAVAAFIDPIINSDIYISAQNSGYTGSNLTNTVWTVASIIGRPGGGTNWNYLGGIWLTGPQGSSVNHQSGFNVTGNSGFAGNNDVAARSQYYGESTYYNSVPSPWNNNPNLNQFKNPHIIASSDGNDIHVSYYDTKDKSIKYRYNRRNSPGTINNANDTPRGWTNLDGGYDDEDRNAASGTNAANFQGVATGNSNRLVNSSRPAIDAGEYNSIALTRNGYPVVAYYDRTNQKLKLAVSNSASPIAAANWKIIENVIPAAKQTAFTGTGQYVSIRIDTRTGTNQDRIHIAAMNSLSKNVVYITGFANFANSTFTGTSGGTGEPTVQVVDSVGSVGRWCALSLDSDGNPWISYQDESYQGARDGIKLAYKNTDRYYKGSVTYIGKDVDIEGVPINGWEAMHVPTAFRVENARSGMECYPTRNFEGARAVQTKFWRGAVGYLGQDLFRAAYYVE
jgi:hypothetical protein